MYDYNFISRVNRALDLYPETLTTIFEQTRESGTQFQKAYLCGLLDYQKSIGKPLQETMVDTQLQNIEVPDIVVHGYDKKPPIKEFMNYGIYVTKVGWL